MIFGDSVIFGDFLCNIVQTLLLKARFWKKPLNFFLEEPKRLKYIDPDMALDNDGILEVIKGRVVPGLNNPPACLEEKILYTVRRAGSVALELDNLEKMR